VVKHCALTPSATIGVTLTAVATAFMFGTSGASFAAPTPVPTDGQVRGAGAADAVKDSYIVVLKNNKAEPGEVSGAASPLIASRPFIDLAEMFFRITGPPAITACPRCRVVTGIDR
jgi:hypothetical protein